MKRTSKLQIAFLYWKLEFFCFIKLPLLSYNSFTSWRQQLGLKYSSRAIVTYYLGEHLPPNPFFISIVPLFQKRCSLTALIKEKIDYPSKSLSLTKALPSGTRFISYPINFILANLQLVLKIPSAKKFTQLSANLSFHFKK